MCVKKIFFCVIAFLMVLFTVQGGLAFNWFGLFPDKVITLDVQFKSEPTSQLDRLNNFFLSHQEFRNLPEGTSIGLRVGQDEVDNHVWYNYILTEKGISEGDAKLALDATIWVSQSFLERLFSTSDVCQFFANLKANPEEGTSYGLLSSRHWIPLRWKYGSGNAYCPGESLWP
jgi:hypothetical protein